MSTQYIMNRAKWIEKVLTILPSSIQNRDEVADDLAHEFGILSGLVGGGWYPNEAVDQYLDREYRNGHINDNDYDEYDNLIKAYIMRGEAEYAANKKGE